MTITLNTNSIKRTFAAMIMIAGSLTFVANAMGSTPVRAFEMRCQLSQQQGGSGESYRVLAETNVPVNLANETAFETIFFLRIEGRPDVLISRDMSDIIRNLPAELIGRRFEWSIIQAGSMNASGNPATSHGLALLRYRGVLTAIGAGDHLAAMVDIENLTSSSSTITMLTAVLAGPVLSNHAGARINNKGTEADFENSSLGCVVLQNR